MKTTMKYPVATAALVAAVAIPISPASATDCGVTQNEWQQVYVDDTSRDNYTKGIVHNIFGFNGQQTVQGDGFETREYKTCGDWNGGWKVHVQYDYHGDGIYGAGWYVERKWS